MRVAPAVFLVAAASLSSGEPAGSRTDPARLPNALEPLVRSYPPNVGATLKSLKLAIDRYLAGSYGAALEALPAPAAAEATALADLVLLYRAKANLALERPSEALSDFRLLES